MKKIEELTDEQDHRMAMVAAEYEKIALSGDDSYDLAAMRRGVDFIYENADLKSPEIVVCTSPWDMAEQAKLEKGQTFDWIGNGFDAGWTAFYDFMEQIGVEYEREWGFDRWRDFIRNSGAWAMVLCENVAFVSVRPRLVERNEAGDLHSESGPAIAWADGRGLYALNGAIVDEALVLTPGEKLDPGILLKEKNAEVRREIVRKIGIERVVQKLGAKSLDRDGDYELLELDLGDGRSRPYLKMKNPSIATWHLEGVAPGIKTVAEALTWRNEIDQRPAVLT